MDNPEEKKEFKPAVKFLILTPDVKVETTEEDNITSIHKIIRKST
jgi:hypothetical protein